MTALLLYLTYTDFTLTNLFWRLWDCAVYFLESWKETAEDFTTSDEEETSLFHQSYVKINDIL